MTDNNTTPFRVLGEDTNRFTDMVDHPNDACPSELAFNESVLESDELYQNLKAWLADHD